MSESEIYLNALLKGDNRIISVIYKKYFHKVSRFVINNKGGEDDAKDVFHDALMYLLVKHREKPLKLNSFEAYLFTTCKNIWRVSLKNKKKWVTDTGIIPLEDKEPDLGLKILIQERLELYKDVFQKLSDNCREVLGNYFNGMSYQEILEDLAYSSLNTVRQRVFKCKTKLVALIKNDIRFNLLK